MTHPLNKARIPRALQARIDKLPAKETNGVTIILGFGMFIDTHRDQPHVGTFTDDIHRGACRPMLVDYVPNDDYLRDPESGKLLERHDKHLFITPDEWSAFLVKALMTTGTDPRTGDGTLPTSHFRDPRAGVYLLKSFRQMVDWNEKRK